MERAVNVIEDLEVVPHAVEPIELLLQRIERLHLLFDWLDRVLGIEDVEREEELEGLTRLVHILSQKCVDPLQLILEGIGALKSRTIWVEAAPSLNHL